MKFQLGTLVFPFAFAALDIHQIRAATLPPLPARASPFLRKLLRSLVYMYMPPRRGRHSLLGLEVAVFVGAADGFDEPGP